VRAMQQFMSEGSWDDTATLHRHWQEVDRDLGEDDGVRLLDGSDFLKQGCESVGVKRRYCGELGKQANCQAGVFLGYASRKGYTLLDRRLYSPQELVTEAAYVERRRRCGAPEEITLTTKPRLGLERRRAIRQASPLSCRWVIGDEAFGRATDRPDRIAEIGLWSFAEVPHDTRVWPQRPAIGLSPGRGRAPPPDARPSRGRGGRARDSRPAGSHVAQEVLAAANNQGRKPGAPGRPLVAAAGDCRAGGLAWSRGVADAMLPRGNRGVEDVSGQRPCSDVAGDVGAVEPGPLLSGPAAAQMKKKPPA
jgi:DDE superfamily endonuclease